MGVFRLQTSNQEPKAVNEDKHEKEQEGPRIGDKLATLWNRRDSIA